MVNFNLDQDLRNNMMLNLDPSGVSFQALPLEEQESKLRPYLEAQKQRDRERLAVFMAPAVAA